MWCVAYRAIGDIKTFTNLTPDAPIDNDVKIVLEKFVDESDVPSNTRIHLSRSPSGMLCVSQVFRSNSCLLRYSEPIIFDNSSNYSKIEPHAQSDETT
jgi:hypothetical protein